MSPVDEIVKLTESGGVSDWIVGSRKEMAFRFAMIYVPLEDREKLFEMIRGSIPTNDEIPK